MTNDHTALEEGAEIQLDFTKLKKVAQCEEGVLPVAVQDADTGEVLIVAYANKLTRLAWRALAFDEPFDLARAFGADAKACAG